MRDKKIKLIYFSLQGSEVKSINLSWKRILSIMFSSFVVMLLMVGSTIALFTDFYKDQRISRLQRTNHALSNQLQHMSGKVNQLESQIQAIEKQDDGLRLMAGLPRIDADLRKLGTGGAYGDYVDVDLNSLPDGLQEETKKVNVLLSELERRVTLHSENVNEVQNKLSEDSDRLKHTPSIRPVLPELSRITDGYGMRYHPLIERKKHHDGVDIAAEIGTDVNAVAAGVVEKAQAVASFGHGYGKYVVIDHGYGFKTLYGHLSKVLVQEGQRVDRWQPIGLVGSTGMTTGPHVHFEVHMNDKPVDPEGYILN
jgi:murein DD-endopeptidase MepM/ murein hydrolase activator NlpD